MVLFFYSIDLAPEWCFCFAGPSTGPPPATAVAGAEGGMLTIRSSLQQSGRKRRGESLSASPSDAFSLRRRHLTGDGAKRADHLGIRKDLTLPSAPTAGEDNVFQVGSRN